MLENRLEYKQTVFGMKKKGDANIVSVVLLIVLVMIVLCIIAAFILYYVFKQGDILSVKAKIGNEQMEIRKVSLNESDSQKLNIEIWQGPGMQEIINRTIGGRNFTFTKIIYYNVTVNKTTYVEVGNVDLICVMDASATMGDQNKLEEAQEATRSFAKNVLNNPKNTVGLSVYNDSFLEEYSHPLTRDSDSLEAKIQTWTADGGTCVCCGIHGAIDYLDNPDVSSGGTKVMVLLTDGWANVGCGEWDPPKEALDAAKIANQQKGIIIHTIAFGEEAGVDLLKEIAEIGQGRFYYADVSELEEVYKKTFSEIVTEMNETRTKIEEVTEVRNVTIEYTGAIENYNYLKIIFYTKDDNSYTSKIDIIQLPGPLETKDIEMTLDPSWGITHDDIVRIEVYPVGITEDGEEVLGPLVAVWEKPRGY